MSNEDDIDLELLIKKYALQNAIKYNGKATANAVLGKILAERPNLKNKVAEVKTKLEEIIENINSTELQTQKELLMKIAPELLEHKKPVVKEKGLAPLVNIGEKVVMRFAPGPSGPLHIGHARAAILNDEYCKKYEGEFILRLEDTNPAKLIPEAYDWIPEDLDWLGVKYHQIIIQSDRFEEYYKYAKKLLEMGKAYVCTCDVEDWRGKKEMGVACGDRNLDIEEQLDRWDRMHNGGYSEGEVSYIIKTDLKHPNPAVRDFIGFRIIDKPAHPRTGSKYRVYPLMNFSVALDDRLLGLTHVLRGKDHLNNTYRQGFIYDYFKWPKPQYIHYGWVSIEDTILKTSEITKKIKNKEIKDWSDIRLGTFRALSKRGIRPEAVRKYWTSVGIKEVDVKFSWETLYSFNRDLVDSSSPRYFFVQNPKRLFITGINELEGHAPIHPDYPEKGVRKVLLKPDNKSGIPVFIPADDWEVLRNEDIFRLKDLCNVSPEGGEILAYAGNDISILKSGNVKIVQWVYASDHLEIELIMPDGSTSKGVGEREISKALDRLVQFERVGFARIFDTGSVDKNLEAVFCHK